VRVLPQSQPLDEFNDARIFLQYTIDVAQHVRIPKSQNAVAFRSKVGIAHWIAFAFSVLPASYLDDDLVIAANEVDHIGPN
jgi:hypothetical protein